MKTLPIVGALASTALLAGCASAAGSPPAASNQTQSSSAAKHNASTPAASGMSAGMVMPDGSTMAPGSAGTAPSEAAKMICAKETRDNIAITLRTQVDKKPSATWKGGTYTCTYNQPAGPIVLTVHESPDVKSAAAYTARMRSAMPGAKKLVGLNPGAVGTKNGVVVLQKDNDTLKVDTSAVHPDSGRLYTHRDEFAYDIAAVLMGCWTGDD